MHADTAHRTLIVANRTVGTPLLLAEVARRARERPTTFALLVPTVQSRHRADWTMDDARSLLERAARGPVEGIVAEGDPLASVKQALSDGGYDDVLISTLPKRASAWLRSDLPRKVQRLGVPVAVISQEEEGRGVRQAMRNQATGVGGAGIP